MAVQDLLQSITTATIVTPNVMFHLCFCYEAYFPIRSHLKIYPSEQCRNFFSFVFVILQTVMTISRISNYLLCLN